MELTAVTQKLISKSKMVQKQNAKGSIPRYTKNCNTLKQFEKIKIKCLEKVIQLVSYWMITV